jgi:DNA-binding transcriptional LysR family regulator
MAIDLRHLRYAVAAAHHGSFRRAADVLGVKQSSLSRRIRQMEDRLGVAVFERSSSGVRLTDAGTEILRASRHLVEGLDRMMASAKAAGRGEAGRLAIGFYTSLSAGNLRASFLEHARRFPEVEIRTVEGARASLFAGLEHGTLDVAIVTGEPAGRERGAMALWGERIMVALPESHPLAANEIVYWTDLRGETFLLSQRDPGPEFRDILLAKLGSPGVQPILVSHDVSREDIMSLVGAGFGVSLICEAAIGASYAGAVYRDVQDGNGPSRISYAAYWQSNNDNPALGHFLKLLEERYPLSSSRAAESAAPSRTPDPSP